MPAATVAWISLRTSIVDDDADCVADVAINSRKTKNSGELVSVVAVTVVDNSRRMPINNSISESDVAAAIVDDNSLTTSKALAEVVVVAAIVVTNSIIPVMPSSISESDVPEAITDCNSRRMSKVAAESV